MRRDVFQAIADPTRRAIVGMLIGQQQAPNVNALANRFKISRPAVSKHIRILSECGLLVSTQKGRDKYYEVKPEKLNEVSEWIEQYRQFWEQKLDALDNYLTALQAKEKNNARKK
ncbi:MAG: metalloregulator ArsR/SmtB family transcription factor [Bacteroidota bacterium]|jgi:DNA-binding transcriptional ArsR family regulator